MGYRRHIGEAFETKKALVFSLVVRDETNVQTFGGGYVWVRKPFTHAQLEQALDDAVQVIVRLGDKALPRDKVRIWLDAQAEGLEDTGMGRLVREQARGKNLVDWPPLSRGRT